MMTGKLNMSIFVTTHTHSLITINKQTNSIISQLENLKREAAEVQKKVEETDVVMAEVERVSHQYLPLSTACSSIYFTLESLNQVSKTLLACSSCLFLLLV